MVELAEEGGGGGVLVEALYIIGRYDLLEDQLGLPVNFTLHQVTTVFLSMLITIDVLCFLLDNSKLKYMLIFQFFKREIGGVEPDRKAMYCVCAGMAQEQTDHLLATR